jgi:hypothetical protein
MPLKEFLDQKFPENLDGYMISVIEYLRQMNLAGVKLS